MQHSADSFSCKQNLTVNSETYSIFHLPTAASNGLGEEISNLPFSLKVLLENLLRFEDNITVYQQDIKAMADWLNKGRSSAEIAYRPARVLMQDFTGVPAIVDLAAMRDAMKNNGGDPERINPLNRVDLVIDHSVQVDQFASDAAFQFNVQREMERNQERYAFLKWGQETFKNFHVVPPGTGICHQVNLEYLAKGVWPQQVGNEQFAFPDTLVGTDSHTTMVNGLGVLGWGVGGIEAEAAMLGQPISMLIPEVIGFKLSGKLQQGITATDLVLTVTEMLRQKGVVGKFVEFYGPGLDHLPLADRATIANMAPEYGATCGFFPIDEETIKYMQLTGRDEQTCALTKAYCQSQGMWRNSDTPDPKFTDSLSLELDTVKPSLAGPKRPQDRVELAGLQSAFDKLMMANGKGDEAGQAFKTSDAAIELHHGDVVIAAITSCTNTSNPSILMAAGLLAKKARERGLQRKPWVKSSLAPGSKVVTDYLNKAGLQEHLDALGFNLVGYGCTTCIGNSGPLPEPIAETIDKNQLVVSSVLSGNRNFEGRVHPQVKANWLASPPLVVAYALAGTTRIDLNEDPIAEDQSGQPVYLHEIWPSQEEIQQAVLSVNSDMFQREYADVFSGDAEWKKLPVKQSQTYDWQDNSTYVKHPPFFENLTAQTGPSDITNARVLALLGDSITTDHISPAGAIKALSPAGEYLQANQVEQYDFNSYGSRRGNHEVMMRGTFANIRIRNEMTPEKEGGFTKHIPTGEVMSIYDAAMRYQADNTPLVIFAGKEYGTGSSRDWAAKGTRLLGVKAVITESFERIHRSNLIGMGVLPCQFTDGVNRESLKLQGDEEISIAGINAELQPGATLTCTIKRADGSTEQTPLLVRIDTENEMRYYQNGGILNYVLLQMLAQ